MYSLYDEVITTILNRRSVPDSVEVHVVSLIIHEANVVAIVSDGTLAGVGKTRCGSKDTYNADRGATIAVQRATHDLCDERNDLYPADLRLAL